MSAANTHDIDWSRFWLEHELSGEKLTVMCPCIEVTFYLLNTDRAALLDLYERVMALIGDQLTHYFAETMKRPAKIKPRAFEMVPTWLSKPKKVHFYYMTMYSGDDLGLHPYGFELSYFDLPMKPGEDELRYRQAQHSIDQGMGVSGLITSSIRLTVPVDHAFADGAQLVAWLKDLALLTDGPFLTGHCGYSLNAEDFIGASRARRKALCLRHPGLGLEAGGGRLSSASIGCFPGVPHIVPLVKRAHWINILHARTVEQLGGLEQLRAAFADAPEVVLHEVPQGVIVQAGPRPELGDIPRHDLLPTLRKVAKVLRPVRVEQLQKEPDEFWDAWIELLDREYDTL